MITKTIIKDEINLLKQYGWHVFTMNSNRYTPIAYKYWPDHTLVHPVKGIVLIEVKIDKDVISQGQAILHDILKTLSCKFKGISFYIANEYNYKWIVNEILNME